MRDRIRRGIREHPLISAVLEVAAERGEPVYAVGGAVRDLALGNAPADLDFAAERPYDLALLFAERYGSRVIPLGKDATPTYRIPLESLKLDWVGLFNGNLEADLARRDFTIDAIAYDPGRDRVLDPTGGIGDLRQRLIRMASPSAFQDDPVRILKAFRLLAQLDGFALERETRTALSAQAPALLDAAPERLQAELDRLFRSEKVGPAVTAMAESGVLFLLFPEMKALEGLGQNDYHHADALTHSLEALASVDGTPAFLGELGLGPFSGDQLLILRLALLLHDTGKSVTRSVGEDGRVHFYGHPKPSADMALESLRRLRFSNALASAVSELCLNHLRPLALIKTSPRRTAIRRLIHSMGGLLQLLLALAYADKSAARGIERDENLAQLGALTREVVTVASSEGPDLRRLPKLVDGLEAMSILGLRKPGPELGRALDALLERQVEGSISDPETARAFLKGWAGKNLK